MKGDNSKTHIIQQNLPKRIDTQMDVIYQTGNGKKKHMGEERKYTASVGAKTMAPSQLESEGDFGPKRRPTVQFGKLNQVIDYDRKGGSKGTVTYMEDHIVETSPTNMNEQDFNFSKKYVEDDQLLNFGGNDDEYGNMNG